MPEIGSTLREARMRARIDITEVEQATKIRAKYLRALENEEWSLLPGPTFIKSFLREYADFLGLDSRTLVEEYKLRYDRPSEHELTPLSPRLGRGAPGPAYGAPRVAPRWLIMGGAIVAILALLALIGSLGGDDEPSSPSATPGATTRTDTATTPRRTRRQAAPTAPAQASVRIVPTGTVYVCLVDGGGRVLIPGSQFAAGQQVPFYKARKLRLTLGNNAVQLRVNGRPMVVQASATAIAYEITPSGARPLPLDQAPTCT
ncbi:MAG TPA: helix-turn-helix domain-containing protein [Conexibacter sp.]|nr:helix-turn-helix domain-containing protein [Conexibacter sp.]